MSSYVPKNINIFYEILDLLHQFLLHSKLNMEEISPSVLDILFPVLFMCYAWQKQNNIPFGNNMLLEKEWLYIETLTSNILSTGQMLWYKNKKGSELK